MSFKVVSQGQKYQKRNGAGPSWPADRKPILRLKKYIYISRSMHVYFEIGLTQI